MLRKRRRLFSHELEFEKQQKVFINIVFRYHPDHIFIFVVVDIVDC